MRGMKKSQCVWRYGPGSWNLWGIELEWANDQFIIYVLHPLPPKGGSSTLPQGGGSWGSDLSEGVPQKGLFNILCRDMPTTLNNICHDLGIKRNHVKLPKVISQQLYKHCNPLFCSGKCTKYYFIQNTFVFEMKEIWPFSFWNVFRQVWLIRLGLKSIKSRLPIDEYFPRTIDSLSKPLQQNWIPGDPL